jgi:hypothetical protein
VADLSLTRSVGVGLKPGMGIRIRTVIASVIISKTSHMWSSRQRRCKISIVPFEKSPPPFRGKDVEEINELKREGLNIRSISAS